MSPVNGLTRLIREGCYKYLVPTGLMTSYDLFALLGFMLRVRTLPDGRVSDTE